MSASRSKVLSQGDVRVSAAPVRVGESPLAAAMAIAGDAAETQRHEPDVSVEHDSTGNVARIHVRCQCGETISIICEYPNAA